jgi:hypothetical protein
MYSAFVTSPKLSEAKAEILISTILEQYKRLNHETLNKAKYNLIKEIKKNYTSIQVVEQCIASGRAVRNSAWNGFNGISKQIYNLEAIGENYYKTKGIRVSTFYSNVEKIENAYYSLIPRELVQKTSFRNPQEEKYQYAVWADLYIFPKAMQKYSYFNCLQRSYGDYIR